MSEPPAIFTLPLAVLAFLWACERRSLWAWLLPGFFFGLTSLIRPDYLPVAVAFALLAAIRVGRERGWRPGLAGIAIFLAAFLIPVLPWTVRNLVVLERFVPISTGDGKALYVGTFLPADGEYQQVKALLAKRYLHRELAPNSAALEHVNPTRLFNRVADPLPGTAARLRPRQDRQARLLEVLRRRADRLPGDDRAQGGTDMEQRPRGGDGQHGRTSAAAAGRRLGAGRALAPGPPPALVGAERDGDADRDHHRGRRRLPGLQPARRDPDDTGVSARRSGAFVGGFGPIV